MVLLLWIFALSHCTSRFAKAIMCDRMERDNGSLDLEYLHYVENISAVTSMFTYQWCENI